MTQDPEDERLVRRALAAWYRSDCDGEYDPVVLTPPISGVAAEHAGKRYVLIVNGPGVPVAAYRVRNDEVLKGLRQWPKGWTPGFPTGPATACGSPSLCSPPSSAVSPKR